MGIFPIYLHQCLVQSTAGAASQHKAHRQNMIDRAVFTPPDMYDFPPDCFGYDPRNHAGRHA